MNQEADQVELFEPGEYLKSTGRPGYFSVLAKPNGQARQESHELRYLPAIIETLNPKIDTWISQAVFNGPNRRAINLRDVGLLFVDLDTYRCKGLIGKTPEEQVALLLLFCGQEEIPAPSIILFSGRGLQVKWLLSQAVEPLGLYEWNQTQLALVRLLAPFAADLAAKDISRVLRLDRTTNTKSGQQCRVIHVSSGVENCPARYDFQELREALVGEVKATAPAEEKRKAADRPVLSLPKEMNLRRLNWFRLYDIRDLWKLRGGVPEGSRELTLFWELNFLLRAEPGKVGDLWKEAASLAAQIAPGTTFYRESDLSTLYRKAREGRAGEMIEYNGKIYPPMYTPRNQTLIELFKITPDEEQSLRTIISQTEKYRREIERRRVKRRAAGIVTRDQYLAGSLTKARPWEAEGISRAWWYRLQGKE